MAELYTLAGSDDGELSASMTEALARRFPDAELQDSPDAGSAAGEGDGGEVSSPDLAPPTEPEVIADPVIDNDIDGLPLDAPDEGFAIAEDSGPEAVVSEETVVEAPTADDDLDLNDLFTRWTGNKPTHQEMVNLFGFIDQVAALTPEQNAELQRILSGQAPVAQNPLLPATGNTTPVTAPQSTLDLPADLDPSARALLEPLYNKIASLEANTAQQLAAQEQAAARQQMEVQQAAYAQAAQVASQQFVAQYGAYLTPTDLVLLETRASRSGQIGVFLNQNNNDMTKAYGAMLEATMLADKDMRARVAAAEAAQASTQAAADAKRTQLAAAVSASPSPTSPETPAKTVSTQTGRRAGMRSKGELAKAQQEASAQAAKALAELTGMQTATVPGR